MGLDQTSFPSCISRSFLLAQGPADTRVTSTEVCGDTMNLPLRLLTRVGMSCASAPQAALKSIAVMAQPLFIVRRIVGSNVIEVFFQEVVLVLEQQRGAALFVEVELDAIDLAMGYRLAML